MVRSSTALFVYKLICQVNRRFGKVRRVFKSPFVVARGGKVVEFPLILTFSRREKEQPLFRFLKLVSIQAAFSGGFARMLGTFLPRPAGEGRSEVEA